MHAFTDCDTVSAFAGRGQVGTFKEMKTDRINQEAFFELSCDWNVSNELYKKLQEITYVSYTYPPHTIEVNVLRFQLFCTKRGEVESSQLLPCKDCLFMNSCRANYQAAI